MNKLFNKGQPGITPDPRSLLTSTYNNARNTLIFVFAFTVVNIVFAIIGSDTYFLFSAMIPYYIALIGAIYCGMMSPEFYEELGGMMMRLPTGAIAVFAVVALVLAGLYLLCWLLSKKRAGWMIAALVFFAIDTLFLVVNYGIVVDMLVDYIFHAGVLWSLISGIRANSKLKKMPPESIVSEAPSFEEAQSAEVSAVGTEE